MSIIASVKRKIASQETMPNADQLLSWLPLIHTRVGTHYHSLPIVARYELT